MDPFLTLKISVLPPSRVRTLSAVAGASWYGRRNRIAAAGRTSRG
jgi:hypothetical protein